jgi:hypothetical protein
VFKRMLYALYLYFILFLYGVKLGLVPVPYLHQCYDGTIFSTQGKLVK